MSNGKRRLDNWISGYLEYTKEFESPTTFLMWTAISTIGAALQRKVRLEWGADVYYPNFYIVLVAPPGRARKGSAMSPARDMLRTLQVPLSADRITLAALVQDLSSATDSIIEHDRAGTRTHSSLTIFSPEFAVFCGRENLELMMALADWFDCSDKWENKTKTMGSEEVIGVFVNLIGATTPSLVQRHFQEMLVGGGLASRVIFVCEQSRRFTSPTPFFVLSEEGTKLKKDLIHDLAVIRNLTGPFRMTENYIKTYGEWYTNMPEICPFDEQHFGSYWSRRSVHVRKLSMIISAARDNELVVHKSDLKAAIQLIEDAEAKMPDVFAGVGSAQDSEIIYKIAEFIKRSGTTNFGAVMREFLLDTNQTQLRHTLLALRDANFCQFDGALNSITATTRIQFNADFKKGESCKC